MNPETIQLIEKFATKLGTTADHIWVVLVRQAYVAAIQDVITLIVSALVLRWLYKKFATRRVWAEKKHTVDEVAEFEEKKRDYPSLYKDAVFKPCAYRFDSSDFIDLIIGSVIAGVLLATSLVASICEVPTALINPEAYALEKITKFVGK